MSAGVVAAHYVASGGGGGSLVSDSFNRANNTSSLGTADSGHVWTALAGTWGIDTNRARKYSPGAQGYAVIDAGVANGTVQATLQGTVSSGGAGGGGVAFRMTDANNGWFTEADGTSGYLYKVAGGGFSIVASYGGWVVGDVVSVVLSGTSIIVKKNGVQVASVTDSFNSTATKHGLRDYGGNIRLDDFSVTA